MARRFHYEIGALKAGEIAGHRTARTISQPYESNYLSATAIAIRPELYPLGVRDGFFPLELTIVRDILAECEGVIRWGGDETNPMEGHFQIDVKPGDRKLRVLAARIDGWNRKPGQWESTARPTDSRWSSTEPCSQPSRPRAGECSSGT